MGREDIQVAEENEQFAEQALGAKKRFDQAGREAQPLLQGETVAADIIRNFGEQRPMMVDGFEVSPELAGKINIKLYTGKSQEGLSATAIVIEKSSQVEALGPDIQSFVQNVNGQAFENWQHAVRYLRNQWEERHKTH